MMFLSTHSLPGIPARLPPVYVQPPTLPLELTAKPHEYRLDSQSSVESIMSNAISFASMAEVQLLLLPVAMDSAPPGTFDKYASEIRSFEELRMETMGSWTEDNQGRHTLSLDVSCRKSNASASTDNSSGPSPIFRLRFPVHLPPQSHAPLSLIRPSHFPLDVIGIAPAQGASLSSKATEFQYSLSTLPRQGSFCLLARELFVFKEGEAELDFSGTDFLHSVSVLPSSRQSRRPRLAALLEEICFRLLRSFEDMVGGPHALCCSRLVLNFHRQDFSRVHQDSSTSTHA